MRRLAYADPPYPGQASRYANGREVNLPLLIAHLREFDGWALSTSSPALREAWNLAPEARVGAWLKTWTISTWTRIRYTWEPVLFVTDRAGKADLSALSTVYDGLVSSPSLHGPSEIPGRGMGAKPARFVEWILELLDYDPDDSELFDLFPGSGNVTRYASARQLDFSDLVG